MFGWLCYSLCKVYSLPITQYIKCIQTVGGIGVMNIELAPFSTASQLKLGPEKISTFRK